MLQITSIGPAYTAVVLGASGGIGQAAASLLENDPSCARVFRLVRGGIAREGRIAFDLTNESSIAEAARIVHGEAGDVALVLNATGVLDRHGYAPEKSLAALDPAAMAATFAINAIGPALVIKHFSTLLPREGKSVLASISARVGSIGDNRLGGWFSYRASKAALNQIVRTSAIEIARKRRDAVCIALHPGTVETSLSAPYAGARKVFTPEHSAHCMLQVIDQLDASATGGFFAHDGSRIEW